MGYAPDRAVIATPIGAVAIEGDADVVHRIRLLNDSESIRRPDRPAVIAAAEQLEAWFSGALQCFDLALAPPATARGKALRDGLIAVPYGETLSYGALARKLASGPRAVGQLCARNPFPIVVPCHRILAADGLGHYSAGRGVETKIWLLDHEQRHRR